MFTDDMRPQDFIECCLTLPKSKADKLQTIAKSLFPKTSARKKITNTLHHIIRWYLMLSEKTKPDMKPVDIVCDVIGRDMYDITSEFHTNTKTEKIFSYITDMFIDREYDRISDLIKIKLATDKASEAKKAFDKAKAAYDIAEQELIDLQGEPSEIQSVEPQEASITNIRTEDKPNQHPITENDKQFYPIDIQHDETPTQIKTVYIAPKILTPLVKRKSMPAKSKSKSKIKYVVFTPEGEYEDVSNLSKYCTEKGIDYRKLHLRIIGGAVKKTPEGYFAWRVDDPEINSYKSGDKKLVDWMPKGLKTYITQYPNGEYEIIVGLGKWAKTHGLDNSYIIKKVRDGKPYKGYKFWNINDPQIREIRDELENEK